MTFLKFTILETVSVPEVLCFKVYMVTDSACSNVHVY